MTAPTSQRPVMLTGGAGYIGSHTCVALHEAGHPVVVVDDFSNSHPRVLDRIETISGVRPSLERGDVLDTAWLCSVFERHDPAAVIHLAGVKAVGESVANPIKYFDINIGGSISLMKAMQAHRQQVGRLSPLVFSSTATVYGEPSRVPITEDFPLTFESPYAHTKLVVEQMLGAVGRSESSWKVAVLRYFNPVGAHRSGLIGEDPSGTPNNLMPFVSQVAVGRQAHLNVFGDDYPTIDGTGVRDYLHVMDLAEGHVRATQALMDGCDSFTVNLGTGIGHSVLQVVKAFEAACGKPIPYRIAARRPGDVAAYFADPGKAHKLLGWQARRDLGQMCSDAWAWQSLNPKGYREQE
ncbi:UDP-glucose 4-epimerase GalE [Hydrogenophaga sp. 5NK40-0174]|uniref:UDP-glucose 4-epimerase GalE n=1 Tax=Hydrogenophaga sp. 5NK40-0174 TaxID=3127649 RepID=UPI00310300FC